jgi:hypothetical protein
MAGQSTWLEDIIMLAKLTEEDFAYTQTLPS